MPGKMIVTGTPELQRALAELEDEMVTRFVVDAAKEGAAVCAAAAKARAPVSNDPERVGGTLKASIRVFDEIDIGNRGATAYFGTDVWYAHFPEFGTIHMPAQSYLRSARDESESKVAEAQVRSLTDNINNLTKKYR